jgi:AAA+ superfamily predicted ATPase
MARADLLASLVKTGIEGNQKLFRSTVEEIVVEERAKQHHIIADRLTNLLNNTRAVAFQSVPTNNSELQNSFTEVMPRKGLGDLYLTDELKHSCEQFTNEYHRRDLLRSYNLNPRHKMLLAGPPGNGKTSLAEGIAHEMMLPLFVVRYEGIINSYLGDTAKQIDMLFEHAKQQRCVLFFDEFDAVSKERDGSNENGEIKRVVNSLLTQLDSLPPHVVFIAATNHASMMDNAFARRFELQLELKKPEMKSIQLWFDRFVDSFGHKLGVSSKVLSERLNGVCYAELEQVTSDIQRDYVLGLPDAKVSNITKTVLKRWEKRLLQTQG